MFKMICLIFLTAMVVSSEGIKVPTNYDLSRQNGLYGQNNPNQYGGFGIRDFVDLLLGGNYNRPGYYPGGNGGGGYGGGSYYPTGPPGPPGAHPGCPLCDSSVYSYCSRKQAHDSCCCGYGYNLFTCGQVECNFLYANTCDEFDLITNCCCVDLKKSSNKITPIDII